MTAQAAAAVVSPAPSSSVHAVAVAHHAAAYSPHAMNSAAEPATRTMRQGENAVADISCYVLLHKTRNETNPLHAGVNANACVE